MRAAIEAGIVEIIYEGETKGLWKFKEMEEITSKTEKVVDEIKEITLPTQRPLPLNDALERWPNARLACSADNLCSPFTPAMRP